MCTSIKFTSSDFTYDEINLHDLKVTENEIQVSFNSKSPVLPVSHNGKNILVKWGNKENNIKLPKTGFCNLKSIKSGSWQWLYPEEVLITAKIAYIKGVWFNVKEGIKGIMVKNDKLEKHCYILIQPSTPYFKIMTGSSVMPVLKNQTI